MTVKRFFPASIVDEIAYLFELSTHYSLTLGFVMTLEGEVDTEVVRKALDAVLNEYLKLKCVLVNHYPSLKRWFRYAWEYRDVTGKDILVAAENPSPLYDHSEVVFDFSQYHLKHSIDITRESPLKVMLIKTPRLAHLIFFVHHAALDGLSVIFLFSSLYSIMKIFITKERGPDYFSC